MPKVGCCSCGIEIQSGLECDFCYGRMCTGCDIKTKSECIDAHYCSACIRAAKCSGENLPPGAV